MRLLATLMFLLLSHCSGSSFSGDVAPEVVGQANGGQRAGDRIESVNEVDGREDDLNSANEFDDDDDDDESLVDYDSVTPSQPFVNNGGDNRGPGCLPQVLPLNLIIVLDISFSMRNSLDLIKGNLMELVSRLHQIRPIGSNQNIPQIGVGIVSYVDFTYSISVQPVTSPNQALGRLNSIQVMNDINNIDGPEIGLQALLNGIEQAKRASFQDAVNVILHVTDNYSHGGRTPNGDLIYDYRPIEMALGDTRLKHLYLYDATPYSPPQDIYQGDMFPREPSPVAQFDLFRNLWQRKFGAIRPQGRSFGFPFSAQTLLNQLPGDISQALKICR